MRGVFLISNYYRVGAYLVRGDLCQIPRDSLRSQGVQYYVGENQAVT